MSAKPTIEQVLKGALLNIKENTIDASIKIEVIEYINILLMKKKLRQKTDLVETINKFLNEKYKEIHFDKTELRALVYNISLYFRVLSRVPTLSNKYSDTLRVMKKFIQDKDNLNAALIAALNAMLSAFEEIPALTQVRKDLDVRTTELEELEQLLSNEELGLKKVTISPQPTHEDENLKNRILRLLEDSKAEVDQIEDIQKNISNLNKTKQLPIPNDMVSIPTDLKKYLEKQLSIAETQVKELEILQKEYPNSVFDDTESIGKLNASLEKISKIIEKEKKLTDFTSSSEDTTQMPKRWEEEIRKKIETNREYRGKLFEANENVLKIALEAWKKDLDAEILGTVSPEVAKPAEPELVLFSPKTPLQPLHQSTAKPSLEDRPPDPNTPDSNEPPEFR